MELLPSQLAVKGSAPKRPAGQRGWTAASRQLVRQVTGHLELRPSGMEEVLSAPSLALGFYVAPPEPPPARARGLTDLPYADADGLPLPPSASGRGSCHESSNL